MSICYKNNRIKQNTTFALIIIIGGHKMITERNQILICIKQMLYITQLELFDIKVINLQFYK